MYGKEGWARSSLLVHSVGEGCRQFYRTLSFGAEGDMWNAGTSGAVEWADQERCW